jgi:N-acetylglucosamine malate deacetylase 2
MATDEPLPTRKDFLRVIVIAGGALLPQLLNSQPGPGKLLIVVAHPDDEYAFAATTYRLVREAGWIADQVIVTDGESGYRYSSLAEIFYGVPLAQANDEHARLASIRKEEASRAGKILGIRRHYFLDQKDLGFTTDAAAASASNWHIERLRKVLSDLLNREKYDVIFTLLPTSDTHGHHRAATLLALDVVASLPEDRRPLTFGAEPRSKSDAPNTFAGLPEHPLTRTVNTTPAVVFDRHTSFGYHNALNYQIVVNWVIAEHKSQGLFQTDCGRHDFEEFWLFDVSGQDTVRSLARLQTLLGASPDC